MPSATVLRVLVRLFSNSLLLGSQSLNLGKIRAVLPDRLCILGVDIFFSLEQILNHRVVANGRAARRCSPEVAIR